MFKIFNRFLKISSTTSSQEKSTLLKLLTTLPECVRDSKDVDSRLAAIASLLKDLLKLDATLLVACDENSLPVMYGGANAPLENNRSALLDLFTITIQTRARDNWSPVDPGNISPFANRFSQARRIDYDDNMIGLIAIQAESTQTRDALPIIDASINHIAWAIHDALQLEEKRLSYEMETLALNNLGRYGPVQPKHIAHRLKEVIRADGIAVFAREHGEFHLSAVTDEELLGNGSTFPALGKELIKELQRTEKAIHIRDAQDAKNFQKNLQSRTETKFDSVLSGGVTLRSKRYQLMALPMRSGQEMELMTSSTSTAAKEDPRKSKNILSVRGQIVAIRRLSSPPFSTYESDAMQRFADQLALAMFARLWLHIAQRMIKARAEAICITRREQQDKKTINRILYAEPGAEALFGLSRNDLIGKDPQDFYASEEEYKRISTLLKESLSRGNNREYGPIKARIKRFVGNTHEERLAKVSYRFFTSPIAQQENHYTLAVIRDITEDEHLSALLAQWGLAYYRANLDGSTVETSEAECQITKYSYREMLNINRNKLYHRAGDRDQLIARAHKAAGALVKAKERLKKKDGTLFWAAGVVHLLKDSSGTAIGYEGLYEDATERVRLQGFLDIDSEEFLQKDDAYSKLEKETRLQLLFISSLGHQLRSPLGAVAEDLKNLKSQITDKGRFRERLEYSIGQVKACNSLVANFTYMDMLLRDEPFSFRPVDIAKLCIETKLNFNHLAEEKGIKIEVIDGEISKKMRVWGHEGLLRQALVNLVDNAIKYSARSSRIFVTAKKLTDSNCLQVSNRGIRIPPDFREEIFFQGKRLPKARMAVPDGTGLGLWIVRKILSAHDAEISCTEIFERNHPRTAFQIIFPTEPPKNIPARRGKTQ